VKEPIYKNECKGEQLTDFENFKSKFEKFISCPITKSKLDNDWLDIFWELSKNNPELADEYYYNFFYNAGINFYVESINQYKKFFDVYPNNNINY